MGSSSSPSEPRSALVRYGAAVVAFLVALALSILLQPIVAQSPFLMFIAAIAFSAWFGGLWPGLLTTALAVQAVNYLFIEPVHTFDFRFFDGVRLGAFAIISIFISSLSETQRRATQSSEMQREQLQVTLASIGDAVIVTDAQGHVTFLNDVAAQLTGWSLGDAIGQPSEVVFRIVNADTRRTVESPVARVLREGVIVGLANHTILIARNGTEYPIDDSGAPIRNSEGQLIGVVLVFRDISEREQAEAARRELLAREQAARAEAERGRERAAYLVTASRLMASSLDYTPTLQQIADLVVPKIADWCVIDLLDDDGTIQMVAAAHVNPEKVAWAYELRRKYPVDPNAPAGMPYVMRSGESQLFADIPDTLLETVARSPEELELLRSVGYRSALVVPLRVRSGIFGAITMVIAESERRYTQADLDFAIELGDRAAVAIDNARLYQAAQEELAQRRRAEHAFQASESQLRLIADALPVLISYLDNDLRYRFNNRGYEEWFGEPPAQITGRHIREIAGETAYAQLKPHLDAALAGRQVSFEMLTAYSTGKPRHIHAMYVPDHAPDGSVRGIVVLVEDISARIRNQEGQRLLVTAGAILAASLDYEATLSHVARLTIPLLGDYAIVYLIDNAGQVVRKSTVHRDPDQEALLLELEQRYPIDLDSDLPVAQVIRSGQPISGQVVDTSLLEQAAQDAEHLRLIKAIGTRAFLAVPLQTRGRTLGVLACATTDANRHYTPEDRRLAEELAYRAALAIDNAALYRETQIARDTAEQSAQRITRLQHVTAVLGATTMPEQVADVVVAEGLAAVEADAGAIFLLADEGRMWEAMSFRGYPDELVPTHKQSPTDGDSPLRAVLETRQLVLIESPEELLQRWPHLAESQARSGDAAIAAVPLLLHHELLGVLYAAFRTPRRFSTDDREFLEALGHQCAQAIDRARLYAAERDARAAAEEAIHLRDLFLSVASHELKTPLTSLLLQTQLLQRRVSRAASLPSRDRRTLQVVTDQALRLDRMITALLDISRLELGQLSLSMTPVNVCSLARRVVSEIAPTTEQHIITCIAPEAELIVAGDELRLEQVLQNLVQNAIKYSPDGGRIEVMVAPEDSQICLRVLDDGIGLPEEALPRLFERFYRAPNADPRQISGMGIGLYVVREIVRLHGGSVRAEQREGSGSIFTVCLPQATTM